MKILEIVYGLSSGGAERLVVDLCNELSKTEEVTLLVIKDVKQFYASQLNSRVHVVYAGFPIRHTIRQHLFVNQFIRGTKPDIVHYHSAARFSCLLSNVINRKRAKFYMTVHSDVENGYKKGLGGLQVRLANSLGHTRFITISDENMAQFKRIYPHYPVRKIMNGRALPQLTDNLSVVQDEVNSYKTTDRTTVYIHVARFDPVKNQRMLITAFNQHVQNGADAILLVLGKGFDVGPGSELKGLASQRVFFLGVKENVYDYLSCADAFCLSSFKEGMPMSIIEAVLSGLPIISTPVCGAIDVVKSGLNGFLAKDFSKTAFLSALIQFEEAKDLIKLNAFKIKDSNEYAISHCAIEYIKWFQEG
jgi:glycosyltransferase involved in cell wall biosynthesis